jgi:hypothetical protein
VIDASACPRLLRYVRDWRAGLQQQRRARVSQVVHALTKVSLLEHPGEDVTDVPFLDALARGKHPQRHLRALLQPVLALRPAPG